MAPASPVWSNLVQSNLIQFTLIPVLSLQSQLSDKAIDLESPLPLCPLSYPAFPYPNELLHSILIAISHLYRALGDIPLSTIEITAMQMVLTMNLTSFAWSVYDGRIRRESECDPQQKSMRISRMPSFLEFLGYCFYFPGVLIGPSTRFTDYLAWADGSLYLSTKGKEKANGLTSDSSSSMRSPPAGRIRASMIELTIGLSFMAAFALFGSKYGFERLVLSEQQGGIKEWSLIKKIAFTQLAGLIARTKYYGIWSLTNGACILSGLGYNGVISRYDSNATTTSDSPVKDLSTRTKWNRCRNIDILNIEFANNWKELLDHWNMNTNVWLRNNVYKRIAKPGSKPGFKSTMATFLTSAFWHGIAPGYYLTFLFGGLAQSVARSLRRHLRPFFFVDPKASNPTVKNLKQYNVPQLFYTGLSIASVQISLNFIVIPFMLLEFRLSLQAWHQLGYYGVIMTMLGIAVFRLGFGKQLDRLSGKVRNPKGNAMTSASGTEDDSGPSGGVRRGPPLQVPDIDAAEQDFRKSAKETGAEINEVIKQNLDGNSNGEKLKKEL